MPREEAEAAFTSNMLARAIGPHKVVIVDTMAFDVLPEDTYFICSDGLHGYLEDADELSAHLDGDLDALNETLIALANERGGKDNISTIALRIHAGEAAPADETQRHSRIIEDLAALSQMQLFSEMAYPELLEIAEALEGAAYEAEQVIVTEGDESDCLYVISTGAVRVERQGQVIATLAPGCHFGEMALLTSRPRSATVIAAEPTRLLALTRATIYELFERRPAIGMKFLWTLAQVQSFRLDEALLQRTTAEPPAVSSSAPPPAKPPASPARARPTLDQTLQGFPAPLSRRVS